MNALKLMKKDHRKVESLFQELEDTTSRHQATRETLFNELKRELEAHAYMEEKLFYPAVKEHAPTHELTLEAYEEHHVVKLLLSELEKMPRKDDEWMAKCKVLIENVRHHVKEEEGELFPKVKDVLDGDVLDSLGLQMEHTKMEFLEKHPVHA